MWVSFFKRKLHFEQKAEKIYIFKKITKCISNALIVCFCSFCLCFDLEIELGDFSEDV